LFKRIRARHSGQPPLLFYFARPPKKFRQAISPLAVDYDQAEKHAALDTTLRHPSIDEFGQDRFLKALRKPKNSNATTRFSARNSKKTTPTLSFPKAQRERGREPACKTLTQ
jgi:hypothetical protein